MIQSVKVTNPSGEVILLELKSPEKSGLIIKSIEGLGPAKSVINTTEVLSADGSFFNSSRISQRNLVFNIGFYKDGLESIETLRQKTYRFFPTKGAVTLEIQTDNRYGKTIGYVESNEPDIFSKDEDTSISILCPSAFFVGAESIFTVFNGSNPLFQFPWENPSLTLPLIEFGSIFINTAQSVVYAGDEATGIIMYVNFLGAVNNLTLFNATLSQTMAIDSAKVTTITGANFQAGDQVVINTNKGSKYIYLIRAGIAYNILNALSTSATWFTIERGDNVFTYTAASGLSNVQVIIEHRIVYRGL